jgi:hypothetical protein
MVLRSPRWSIGDSLLQPYCNRAFLPFGSPLDIDLALGGALGRSKGLAALHRCKRAKIRGQAEELVLSTFGPRSVFNGKPCPRGLFTPFGPRVGAYLALLKVLPNPL